MGEKGKINNIMVAKLRKCRGVSSKGGPYTVPAPIRAGEDVGKIGKGAA